MLDSKDNQKLKINSLVSHFISSGYKSNNKLGQSEYLIFLNKHTNSGTFDHDLSDKLFQVLSLDDSSTITIEEFINGFLLFEEDIIKNTELLNIKYNKELEIYNQLCEEFRRYKEQLNEEGFCENAKIYGEITDIDLKRRLEGIKEIIIIVIYNDKSEELHFKIGDINSNEMANKTFEFKPKSRKDHFEFIMKGLNDRNQLFDIGSKVFPLNEVNSYEEYKVQIIVPEIENEEKIVAYINAKIILYWSDYKYYEQQIKKREAKLNKLKIALNKAEYYLEIIREIYGDLTIKKPDIIVDFNNEKLMQRKGAKLNVDFNNVKKAETTRNYVVEFNNQKDVLIKEKEIKEEIIVKKEEKKEEPPAEENRGIIIQVENIDNNFITEKNEIINEEYNTANQEEYQNIEQLNYEDNVNINYDEYNNNNIEGYEQIDQNITELKNTETVAETEIRNSINEALIRQSTRKPVYTSNVLPPILKEKVNEIIVDNNATYLPVIYGGKKVTHVNSEMSTQYDYNNLIQQGNGQTIQGEDYSQLIQSQENNNQNFGTQEYFGNNQVQNITFGEYESTKY